MNMNYGRLSNGRIEYAPSSLETCARAAGVGLPEGAKRLSRERSEAVARGREDGVKRKALARPYETAALSQSLVSVGFPRRLRRRPSKRTAFFGGYAIKGYARMTDEQAEAILSKCIYEED